MNIISIMKLRKENIQYLAKKFINHLMIDGKKEKAENIFAQSLNLIRFKDNREGIFVVFKALVKTKPFIELRSVRRGGASYQVPVPLQEKRSICMAIKWIIDSSRKKKGSFVGNLATCIIETSKNTGDVVKKRESIHLTALKNRSFTHYRWF